jgi:hypothetical protein
VQAAAQAQAVKATTAVLAVQVAITAEVAAEVQVQ